MNEKERESIRLSNENWLKRVPKDNSKTNRKNSCKLTNARLYQDKSPGWGRQFYSIRG